MSLAQAAHELDRATYAKYCNVVREFFAHNAHLARDFDDIQIVVRAGFDPDEPRDEPC
jgi:hypothetical protein